MVEAQKRPVYKIRYPSWFIQKIPDMKKIWECKSIITQNDLNTVCVSAKCPNWGTCWQNKTATFMILGHICSRACRFCAVQTGQPEKVNQLEPRRVALAVEQLNLEYVVLTSVTRDDLEDFGISQFVATVKEMQRINPRIKIEVLIPDFQNQKYLLKKLVDVKPDVIGHNMETVPRLYKNVRKQSDYKTSLNVLKNIKGMDQNICVKSGFMVGLGETRNELSDLMGDIKRTGCDILTIGQYLSPTRKSRNVAVQKYYDEMEFAKIKKEAENIGFTFVLSGPLVRSSFKAAEVYHHWKKQTR